MVERSPPGCAGGGDREDYSSLGADERAEDAPWAGGLPKDLLSESALGGPLSAALLEEVERGVLRAIGVPVD